MCIYRLVTFVKAQLFLHSSSVLNVILLCITARCIKIFSIIISITIQFTYRTSCLPVFNVVFKGFQTFFTERDIFIASDQTCIKIYQDKNAKKDFCGNKNHSFYLLIHKEQHLYWKYQNCGIIIHFHTIDSFSDNEAFELLYCTFDKNGHVCYQIVRSHERRINIIETYFPIYLILSFSLNFATLLRVQY